jgi:hypothetical protein
LPTMGWARTQPRHLFAKSEFFRHPLPGAAIAALVATFSEDRASGHSRALDFMPWGGAYNRVRPDATAFVHRPSCSSSSTRPSSTPGDRGHGGGRPRLGRPILGVGASVGIGARVPELRRSGP